MKKYKKAINKLSTLSLLAMIMTLPVAAQTNRSWDNSSGGSYDLDTNWTPIGVPGGTDPLFFALDSTYTVNFNGSQNAQSSAIRDGDVTFNVGNANTFSLVQGITVGGVNTPAAATPRLTLNSGTAQASNFLVGSDGNTGIMTITGSSTELNVSGATSIIGDTAGSNGTVNIQGGAKVTTGALTLGNNASTTGSLNVSGTGSSLTSSGVVIVGRRAHSFMNLTDGATVTTDTGAANETSPSLIIGNRPGLPIVVVDNAALNVNQSLRIGDSTSSATGNGRLIIQNEGVVTVQNELVVGIGNGDGTGELFISGTETKLNVLASAGGGSWIGGRGATDTANGHFSVSDGAEVNFSGVLNIRANGKITIDAASITTSTFYMRGSTGILEFVLNTGHFDPMFHVTNTTVLNSEGDNSFLNIVLGDNFTAEVDDTFSLLNYGGNLNGEFFGLEDGQDFAVDGYTFRINYGTGNNSAISLSVVAIPEPGHIALLVGLACLGAVLLRKKMRKAE